MAARKKNVEIDRIENPSVWDTQISLTTFVLLAGGIQLFTWYMGRRKAKCMAVYAANHAGEGTPEEVADKAAKECTGFSKNW